MDELSTMIENLEGSSVLLSEMEPVTEKKMFSAKDIPEIVRIFREADVDGSGALDMEEFSVAMEQFYGSVTKEDLEVLHMQIDANCDGTVDIGELLNFLIDRQTASEFLDFKNQPFPLPLQFTPINHRTVIVRLVFRPSDFDNEPDQMSEVLSEEIRAYQKGEYLSISSDGIFTFWSHSFDDSIAIPLYKSKKQSPFGHAKKMHVTDMVYLEDLNQVAISTTDRELLFYTCGVLPELFEIAFSLIVDDSIINAMHYWYHGITRMFSFGDTQGDLYVFVSKNVGNSLFCAQATQGVSSKSYAAIYVADLIQMSSDTEACIKLKVFNDMCAEIRYFPSLESYAICGSSYKTMAIIGVPEASEEVVKTKSITKHKLFESWGDHEFFTCVEYSSSADRYVTGGTDGLIRVWSSHNSSSWECALQGHAKTVTHLMFNHRDRLLLSFSDDMNVRVWSEDGWVCRQSFQVEGMKPAPNTCVYYNMLNNELVIANSDIGKFLGRGTDVFKNMLKSHDKPLCAALYHSIFKQVISVCQNGVVTVWDILTGNAVMQFNVSHDRHVGLTAISFDEEGRRLVTISTDGKVRLWNFNSGMELSVLPVTIANEVTAIVCVNNRMFVSSRNSKIIYDLDMEEDQHRYLKHHYLDDISSMDVNVHENTLSSASSNGNIVIWVVETAEVLYCVNTRVSPQTILADKHLQGKSGILATEKKKNIIKDIRTVSPLLEKKTWRKKSVYTGVLIKCLRTRETSVCTATLLTSADGFICAWSVKSKGGLLVKFRAVNAEGAVVTTMSTDASEKILFTGDSTGGICLWDIEKFGFNKQAEEGQFENINGWLVSLCPPPLLGSWQAHCEGIVTIICDPTCKNIITAGLDQNVCLWTKIGKCIGIFGSDEWEATSLHERNNDPGKNLYPADIGIGKTSQPKEPTSGARARPLRPIMTTVAELLDRYPKNRKFLDDHLESKVEGTPSHLEISDAQEWVPSWTPKYHRNVHKFRENALLKGPPYLKWSRSKDGRLALKRARPPPCPPPNFVHAAIHKNEPKPVQAQFQPRHQDSLAKTVEQFGHTIESQHLPLIPEKVQLTQDQTQFKPQPPKTPHPTGRTDKTNSSSRMQRSASASKQGSGRGTLGVPLKLENVQLQHGQTQENPILEKGQLTRDETPPKPEPQTP